MRLDGRQHVREAARDVRPDRFVLQRAGEREHLRLVGGDREMVGPEMDQSLAKRFFGRWRQRDSAPPPGRDSTGASFARSPPSKRFAASLSDFASLRSRRSSE